MGNALGPCFQENANSAVKVIFSEGTTRLLRGKHIAGEIMFEFPDRMVCHGDSFFIGHPIPALAIDDELMHGQTYFVLPIDRFACSVLSASSLAALRSPSSSSSSSSSTQSPNKNAPINFGESPFEYIKASNGKVLIKVVPEFITRLITRNNDKGIIGCGSDQSPPPSNGFLCSTPELQKHYEQLVGSKEQLWSPKLETISEHKVRFSPCRFIGLEWKQKEEQLIM